MSSSSAPRYYPSGERSISTEVLPGQVLRGWTGPMGFRRYGYGLPSAPKTLPKWGTDEIERTKFRTRRVRRLSRDLRKGGRVMVRERCRHCGETRIAPSVSVGLKDGRATLQGLMTCGSVWECAVCAVKILSYRAEEVTEAVAAHGAAILHDAGLDGNAHKTGNEHAMMLTLTVKHGIGDKLRYLRERIAKAWRLFCSGEPWKRWKRAIGFVGSVRRLELTHGENGWHPHLHILLLSRTRADSSEWAMRKEWVTERWLRVCEKVFGFSNLPDAEHGVRLTPARDNYLTKLGLEVASALTKPAHDGHRAPFDILRDAIETGDLRDRALFQDYCRSMLGARQLTWSLGLRDELELGKEVDDVTIASDEEPGELVCTIDGKRWDAIKRKNVCLEVLEECCGQRLPDEEPGEMPICYALLIAAETGGRLAVEALVALASAGTRLAPPKLEPVEPRDDPLDPPVELEPEQRERVERFQRWRDELYLERQAAAFEEARNGGS